MGGALAVAAAATRLRRGLRAPLLGGHFAIDDSEVIDGRLLGGAALFGLGWGALGFCPGPAVVAAGAGAPAALWFAPAMLVGLWLERRLVPVHDRCA